MPIPVSVISISTLPLLAALRTSSIPPEGMASLALRKRFKKTCCKRLLDPKNAREIAFEILEDLDVGGTKGMSGKRERFFNHLIEIYFLEFRAARAREIEEIIDDFAGPESLLDDSVG